MHDPAPRPGHELAELHVHLSGSLAPRDALDRLVRAAPYLDTTRWEAAHRLAFDAPLPPLHALIERHRDGHPDALAGFEKLFVYGEDDAGSFARFQARYELLIIASALQWVEREGGPALPKPRAQLLVDEYAELTEAVCRSHGAAGVGYVECRTMPKPGPMGGSWREIAKAMAHGASRAADVMPAFRLAPSLPRSDPWGPWEEIEAMLVDDDPTLATMITAVDFCHVEEGHSPLDKRAFFDAVHSHNARRPDRAIAVLYHVGESFTDKSLESAVRWVQQAAELGAHRLGHAIALGADPARHGAHTRRESVRERRDQIAYDQTHADALERHGVRVDRAALADELRRLADARDDATVEHVYDAARLAEVRARQDLAIERVRATGAVIEVCPTSNRRIGGLVESAHHPVHRFLAAGLRVVVAADDPGIFATTLRDEIAWVAREAALGPDEVRALVDASWKYRSEKLVGRTGSR